MNGSVTEGRVRGADARAVGAALLLARGAGDLEGLTIVTDELARIVAATRVDDGAFGGCGCGCGWRGSAARWRAAPLGAAAPLGGVQRVASAVGEGSVRVQLIRRALAES